MKTLIKYSLITLMLSLTNMASADKVCQKLTLAGNKIRQKIATVSSTAACPKGSTEIINTATLTGIPGPQGTQGPAGGFLPTLPSGQVMNGVYGGVISTTATGDYVADNQTFPYALPSDMVATHYIKVGDPAIAECPGTAAAPDASPGHLCLFEANSANRSGTPVILNPASSTSTLTNWRLGFMVYSNSSAAGASWIFGSYAVRAQ
jgi:hypothetical protein